MPMITEYGPWTNGKKPIKKKIQEGYLTAAPEITILYDTNVVDDIALSATSIDYAGLNRRKGILSIHKSVIAERNKRRINYIFNSVYLPPDITTITAFMTCTVTRSFTIDRDTYTRTKKVTLQIPMTKQGEYGNTVWLPEENQK